MFEAKHMSPPEGLEHPAFAEISAGDDLIVRIYYDHWLNDKEFAATDGLLGRWSEAVDWQACGGQPEQKEASDGRLAISLRLGGVNFCPREPLEKLVQMLSEHSIGIHELFLSRWETKDEQGLMGPVNQPGAPAEEQYYYENQDTYFDAVFDPESTPPATENDIDCKGILNLPEGGVSIEMRAHRLFHPQVRIAYGIYENYRTIEGDDRTAEIEQVLAEELDRAMGDGWNNSFEHWTPKPMTFAREEGYIDTLVARGRRGYEMLFFANSLRVPLDKEFRQREPEMMEALAATIERLDLAPVITWMRYGISQPMMAYKEPFKYFFQLWEKELTSFPEVEPRPEVDYPAQSAETFYQQWLERVVPRWHLRRNGRHDCQLLQDWTGLDFPDDLKQLFALRDKHSFNTQFVNNWVLDDADLPLPDPQAGNVFDQFMEPNRIRLLGPIFAGAVPVGYLDGARVDLWAGMTPGAERVSICTHAPDNHECQHMADGLASLRLAADLAARQWQWDQAMDQVGAMADEDPDSYQDPGPAPDLGPLEGRVRPLFDFSNLYLTETLPEGPGAGGFMYRAFTTLQLLGVFQAPDMAIMAENFRDTLNQRPNYQKSMDSGNVGKLALTSLYWLWTFFFLEDERLEAVLERCRQSPSLLISDAAKVVDELLGGRKHLGPFEDVLTRRTEFMDQLRAIAPEAIEEFRD